MARQVKTLIPGLTLPDGNTYFLSNSVVTLTDEQFARLDPGVFGRGWLQDLGATSGGDGGGPAITAPLFSIEDNGAIPDGTTDNFDALMETCLALTDSTTGGEIFGPTLGVYRFAITPERMQEWDDQQFAALPIPMRPRSGIKRIFGLRGVGSPYVVRTADLGGTPGQVGTATVFWFDYDPDDFGWTPGSGHPSVFGCVDPDMTDNSGNTFSNLHFTATNLILRNTPNPSLCMLNLEQVSTVDIGRLRIDVNAVLEGIPEPTHPTGAAILLPRSNNNVAVTVRELEVEGHFAGIPLTEHGYMDTGISLRNKIGVFTRRPCSHVGKVNHLKIEQVPWGFAGYEPSAATAEEAIVPWKGWTGHIGFVDYEDYAYNGQTPWMYAPTAGAHIHDPEGKFNGTLAFWYRINSEPVADPGIGVEPTGGGSSVIVNGPSGMNSPLAILGFNGTAAQRLPSSGGAGVDEIRLFDGVTDLPVTSTTDSQPLNLGVNFKLDTDESALGIGFYRATLDIAGTITGRLWRVSDQAFMTGSDVTFDIGTTTGWKFARFTSPVPLVSTERYVAVVRFPDKWCVTSDFWGSGAGTGGIVVAPLRAFSNADTPGGQGIFSTGAITNYPGTSGSGNNYWVDVIIGVES